MKKRHQVSPRPRVTPYSAVRVHHEVAKRLKILSTLLNVSVTEIVFQVLSEAVIDLENGYYERERRLKAEKETGGASHG